jgi:hypothetical protein
MIFQNGRDDRIKKVSAMDSSKLQIRRALDNLRFCFLADVKRHIHPCLFLSGSTSPYSV